MSNFEKESDISEKSKLSNKSQFEDLKSYIDKVNIILLFYLKRKYKDL